MEASKLIQGADFDRWKAEGRGPGADGPDLAASRARIDGLDGEILGALAEVGPPPLPERMRRALPARSEEILVGDGIDDAVRERATRPLQPAPAGAGAVTPGGGSRGIPPGRGRVPPRPPPPRRRGGGRPR